MSASRRKGMLAAIWAVLIALIAVIVLVDRKDDREEQLQAEIASRGEDRERNIIPIPIEQVGAIEVAHAGTLHRFERDPEGVWFYHGIHTPVEGTHGHQTDPALADLIRTKLLGLARGRREREIPLDPKSNDYGLTTPQTLVLVYRIKETQPLAQFAFGDKVPDGVSRYMLELGAKSAFTIADFQYDNLMSLVDAIVKANAAASAAPAAAPEPAPASGSPAR